MPSIYAEVVPAIALDIHALLVKSLELTTDFRAGDPNPGESFGWFRAKDISDGDGLSEMIVAASFTATAAYNDYWAAQHWALKTGLNLRYLIPKIKTKINKRGVFSDLIRTAPIVTGNPRSPLLQPNGQQSHIWIVDVSCSMQIKLMINADAVFGMR